MNASIRDLYPQLPPRVEIIDCTLRDGEQTPGVWFTLAEKLELASLLSEAGASVLDAGFPGSSEADVEALQELHGRHLRARIGATARPLERDVMAAEKACADEVFLFMPMSERRLRETLGITPERAGAIFRAGAEAVVGRGMGLNLVFEDATRADPVLLIRTVEALRAHVPIARVVICDTVSCGHPAGVQALVHGIDQALGGEIALCAHHHNDFGLASANTLAAVAGGARSITCTVNGIGERAGNADLAECAAALTHLYGIEHDIEPRSLPLLSSLVERMSGIHVSATKPVTGFNVYRHESGVHVDAMLKDARSYEFLPAAWTGRQSEYVLGKHSGTAAIRHVLRRAGVECAEERLCELLGEVKRETEQRDKSDHARWHAIKEAFMRVTLSGVDPATVVARCQAGRTRTM